MATATFFTGLIKTTAGYIRNPYCYYDDWAQTKPPFAVSGSGTSEYVTINNLNWGSPNAPHFENASSPLCVKVNNTYQGKWADIMSGHITTETLIVKFGSGWSIKAFYNSTYQCIEARLYNASDAHQATFYLPYGVSASDNVVYCALTVLQSSDGQYFISSVTINFRSGSPKSVDYNIPTANAGDAWKFNSAITGSMLETSDPYGTSDEPIATGGYGSFDYGDGDDIPAPTKPSISASDSGFVTLFNPTISEIQDLSDYMWSGLFDIGPWKKLMADPMDCIISLNIVPVLPHSSGTRELKVGNVGTGKFFNVIDEQFVEIDCGTIRVNGKTASNLDYSPYLQASIYLPFIGERSLDADDIMDSDITLTYIIDLFSGACTANIVCSKDKVKSWNKTYNKSRLLYTFSGNCACNIPYTNANYSSMLQSIITAIGVGATAIATKGASLAGAAGIAQAGALVQSVTNEKPVISKSGNMGGTAGFMGQRTPYLIIKWPNMCRPKDVNKEIGQPAYLRGQLKNFHGFTRVHETFLGGLPCTEQERTEIDNLLKSGVILP